MTQLLHLFANQYFFVPQLISEINFDRRNLSSTSGVHHSLYKTDIDFKAYWSLTITNQRPGKIKKK